MGQYVIATDSFAKSWDHFSDFPVCIWIEFHMGQKYSSHETRSLERRIYISK